MDEEYFSVQYNYNGSPRGKPARFEFRGTMDQFLNALKVVFQGEHTTVYDMKITNYVNCPPSSTGEKS